MLKEDVVDAIKDGKFNVYPVKTIDEGIEVLTGVHAGEKVDDEWTPGSINEKVQKRLNELAQIAKEYRD
jgi:predicted ATP-dependent protease